MSDHSNIYTGASEPTRSQNPPGNYLYPPGFLHVTSDGFPAASAVHGYQRRSNGLGIAALVLGIVGLVLVWVPVLNLLLGILATILGGVGLANARQGKVTGKGIAISGLTLGIVTLATTFLSLLFAIADLAGQS